VTLLPDPDREVLNSNGGVELRHAIYDRIVVAGDKIVSERLTPDAMRTEWRSPYPRRLQWRARQVLDAR
jgi:hypothetical protein